MNLRLNCFEPQNEIHQRYLHRHSETQTQFHSHVYWIESNTMPPMDIALKNLPVGLPLSHLDLDAVTHNKSVTMYSLHLLCSIPTNPHKEDV